ncbi:MAG: hypothetical protein AAF380_03190, partial [Bacteroidota bacterium]
LRFRQPAHGRGGDIAYLDFYMPNNQIKRFKDWLVAEEMEEEAIIEDIKTPTQSNIEKYNPSIFKNVNIFFSKVSKHKTAPKNLAGAKELPTLLYILQIILENYPEIEPEDEVIYTLSSPLIHTPNNI